MKAKTMAYKMFFKVLGRIEKNVCANMLLEACQCNKGCHSSHSFTVGLLINILKKKKKILIINENVFLVLLNNIWIYITQSTQDILNGKAFTYCRKRRPLMKHKAKMAAVQVLHARGQLHSLYILRDYICSSPNNLLNIRIRIAFIGGIWFRSMVSFKHNNVKSIWATQCNTIYTICYNIKTSKSKSL